MRNIHKLVVTVPRMVPVNLDREWAHILSCFKPAHPSLGCLIVMTRIPLASPADDVVLTQVIQRLTPAVLPVLSLEELSEAAEGGVRKSGGGQTGEAAQLGRTGLAD